VQISDIAFATTDWSKLNPRDVGATLFVVD
jgi:hypothetical protein